MTDKEKEYLALVIIAVDCQFDEFVKRLDTVLEPEDFGDYKKLYNAAFEMRSTVSLQLKRFIEL